MTAQLPIARILRWVATAGILILLVVAARRVDWPSTWAAMRNASLVPLALALAVNLVSLTFKAMRWWVFLRPVGVSSLGLAVRATFVGGALNNVLIANAGEAARTVFISRATGVSNSSVLAALTMERLFEFLGYFMLLVGTAFALDLPPAIDRWRLGAVVVLIAVLAFLAYLVSRPSTPADDSARGKERPTSLTARVQAFGSRYFATLGAVTTLPRLFAALGLTVLSWGLQVVTYHLAALSGHLDLPLTGSLAALLAANLGFLIRTTPGNVGVFQLIYVLAVQPFAVSKDAAVGVAVLLQTLQILPVTVIGVALAPEFVFRRRPTTRAVEPV